MPPPAASPSDARLLRHLAQHADEEEIFLGAYAVMAIDAPEHVRYLMRLVLEDEERHHRILEEMRNAIVAHVEFRHAGPEVPGLPVAHHPELLEVTERFLRFERESLRQSKAMRRELRRQRHRSLYPLLLKQMELDTRKHIATLKFIRAQAKRPV